MIKLRNIACNSLNIWTEWRIDRCLKQHIGNRFFETRDVQDREEDGDIYSEEEEEEGDFEKMEMSRIYKLLKGVMGEYVTSDRFSE